MTAAGLGTLTFQADQPGGAGYSGASATQSFNVGHATATVTLSNLTRRFDGTAKSATAAANAANLTTTVTHNGSATAPSSSGNYAVVATGSDANYTGTLAIGVTPPLDLCRRIFGPDHPTTSNAMGLIASIYHDQARYEEALSLHRATTELRRKNPRGRSREHPYLPLFDRQHASTSGPGP